MQAALHAVGHEFRPTAEQRTGTNPCAASNGVTASVVFYCNEASPGSGCENPSLGKLYAEWRKSDGGLDSAPILIAEGYYAYDPPYSCSADGTILLVLEPVPLVIDRQGVRRSQSEICDTDTCFGPFGVSASADDFLIVWPVYRRGLVGRWFDQNGVSTSDSFLIAESAADYIFPAEQGILTPAGDVVLAWNEQGSAGTSIQAVLVGNDGSILPPIRVNEFSHIDILAALTLGLEAPDRFLVAWENEVTQAGWIARRVIVSEGVPTTTTTTTTLDPDVPVFLPAKEIGTPAIGDDTYVIDAPGLVGDGSGHWFATWLDSVPAGESSVSGTMASSSSDGARHWSVPQPFHAEGYPAYRASAVANDDTGVAVAAWARSDGGAVLFRRSTDGGQTWTEADALYASPYLTDEWNRFSQIDSVVVAAGGEGHWTAAWTEAVEDQLPCDEDDYGCVDYTSATVLCAIRYAVSADGGLTWASAQTIENGICWDRSGLQIAGDVNGNWLAVWAQDRDIRGAYSLDDAQHWSASQTIHSGIEFARESLGFAPARLSIAANDDGQWLMAFAHWLPDPPNTWPYTHARVFVSRADNPFGAWSAPAGIAPWHDELDGKDLFPSIAAGDDGEFAIAWSSHSAESGLDADIVAAFSSDDGLTWSAPRLVDTEARIDPRTDLSPRIVRIGSTWAVIWRTIEPTEHRTIRFARTRGDCGNGGLDPAEHCDDANLIEGDGCDSSCLFTGCGSQVVTEGEECDDGNLDDTDECISCRLAYCGDGFVRDGAEECDDANDVETDACLSDCVLATCGEGIVWAGVEICDDSAADNNGACLTDCTIARCGDGYLALGEEECDDGNLEDGDACANDCMLDPDCAFFNSSGLRVRASDALRVLKSAVGIAAGCPLRNCDLNDDGSVTAGDALWTLRSAVGLFAEGCTWPTSLVVRMTSSETIAALQFEMSYRDAAGHIVAKPDGKAACEILVPHDLVSMNWDPERGALRLGLIELQGFEGPLDLLRCDYEPVSGPSLYDFRVTVEDAVDIYSYPVEPLPLLELTAE